VTHPLSQLSAHTPHGSSLRLEQTHAIKHATQHHTHRLTLPFVLRLVRAPRFMRPNPVFGGGLTAHRVLCDDSRSCRNYLQAPRYERLPAKYAADDPFCDHQYTARRLASQSGAAEQTPPYRDSIAAFEAALNFTNDAQSRKYGACGRARHTGTLGHSLSSLPPRHLGSSQSHTQEPHVALSDSTR
jgi:hypothetical protein